MLSQVNQKTSLLLPIFQSYSPQTKITSKAECWKIKQKSAKTTHEKNHTDRLPHCRHSIRHPFPVCPDYIRNENEDVDDAFIVILMVLAALVPLYSYWWVVWLLAFRTVRWCVKLVREYITLVSRGKKQGTLRRRPAKQEHRQNQKKKKKISCERKIERLILIAILVFLVVIAIVLVGRLWPEFRMQADWKLQDTKRILTVHV